MAVWRCFSGPNHSPNKELGLAPKAVGSTLKNRIVLCPRLRHNFIHQLVPMRTNLHCNLSFAAMATIGLAALFPVGSAGRQRTGKVPAPVPGVVVRDAPRLRFRGANSPSPSQPGDTDCNSPLHWDGATLYLFNSAGQPLGPAARTCSISTVLTSVASTTTERMAGAGLNAHGNCLTVPSMVGTISNPLGCVQAQV